MVRSAFSSIKFLASATDLIVTSLRDPAGLVAVGAGRGVFVETPVAAWVEAKLGVRPAPQPASSTLRTTSQMMTINLIRLMFMFLLITITRVSDDYSSDSYELMKALQPPNGSASPKGQGFHQPPPT